jgi:hypothetical protein
MVGLLALVAIGPGIVAEAMGAERPPFSVATAALLGSRSEKVRVQAALVLGKRRDARATPFLLRALADVSPAVRAVVAQALGKIADETARPGLEVAANDKSALVRHHATAALEALAAAQADTQIDVKAMGDRTKQASPQLREQMRRAVAAELSRFKKHAPGGLAVDGSIKALGLSTRADQIEVKCAVELILSTGRGSAIVMMTSGEAIVQRQKRQYRPAMQQAMEQEAMEHAVHGASDELREHFAANGF